MKVKLMQIALVLLALIYYRQKEAHWFVEKNEIDQIDDEYITFLFDGAKTQENQQEEEEEEEDDDDDDMEITSSNHIMIYIKVNK